MGTADRENLSAPHSKRVEPNQKVFERLVYEQVQCANTMEKNRLKYLLGKVRKQIILR